MVQLTSKFTIALVCLHGPWQICEKNLRFKLLMSTRALNKSRMLVKGFSTRVLVKRSTARQGYLSRDTQISAHEKAVPHVSVNLCVVQSNTEA